MERTGAGRARRRTRGWARDGQAAGVGDGRGAGRRDGAEGAGSGNGRGRGLVPGRTVTRLADAKALRAYAHPVRMKLIVALRTRGPLTATQAGAAARRVVGDVLVPPAAARQVRAGRGDRGGDRAGEAVAGDHHLHGVGRRAAGPGGRGGGRPAHRGARRVVLHAAHAVPGGTAAGERGMAAGRVHRRPLPVGDRRRARRDPARHQRGHRPVLRAARQAGAAAAGRPARHRAELRVPERHVPLRDEP